MSITTRSLLALTVLLTSQARADVCEMPIRPVTFDLKTPFLTIAREMRVEASINCPEGTALDVLCYAGKLKMMAAVEGSTELDVIAKAYPSNFVEFDVYVPGFSAFEQYQGTCYDAPYIIEGTTYSLPFMNSIGSFYMQISMP